MITGWLTGWKRIAEYCNVSIRTAKTYHYKFGMPIKRLPGGSPQALPVELDNWSIFFHQKKQEQKKKAPADRGFNRET